MLIGSVRGGSKNGVPLIGVRVVSGNNASVVGNIRIGNDVLIAANSFVNFDVPDNSVVIGSSGVIHYKDNPVKHYIL